MRFESSEKVRPLLITDAAESCELCETCKSSNRPNAVFEVKSGVSDICEFDRRSCSAPVPR